MKITLLGTSHGVPEANRRCSCTLIETRGRYYLVDLGIQPFEELVTRNIPAEAIQAVFITHMHGDHANGLVSFVDLLSWHFTALDPAIFVPDTGCADVIRQWMAFGGTEMRRLRFTEIQPGVILDDGYLRVTAIPTKHCPGSHAFLIEAEGKTVLFTGDLKHPTVDFPTAALERPTDLIICEAAHFTAADYLSVLSRCSTRIVCVNHYVAWNIPNVMQLGRELAPTPVILANDNMEINI